eukprot:TRINITY_DN2070_c0_g1_i1.p1 TRINITY_DN2070_c0_g1~~TRINITY_DN2070_c0_g1_i1.p1  ORF type:complete len:754 (+),score=157.08 TRINITY_DN2070_c0_g1_i1:83-2344(+)
MVCYSSLQRRDLPQEVGMSALRRGLWSSAVFGCLAVTGAAAPALHDSTWILEPGKPYHAAVSIHSSTTLRFKCGDNPADAIVSLTTKTLEADPLISISLDPDSLPTILDQHASTMAQWREGAHGSHYVTVQGIGPRGGSLRLTNTQFAQENLDATLDIRCSAIIAFDGLFGDNLESEAVCPFGDSEHTALGTRQKMCSGHGRCGRHGQCFCDGDHTGSACEHSSKDLMVAAQGHSSFLLHPGKYQYFRVRVNKVFPGGVLTVKLKAERPLALLVRSGGLPTKARFNTSNFDDWLRQSPASTVRMIVPAGARHRPKPTLLDFLHVAPKGGQCPKLNQAQLNNAACKSSDFVECKKYCTTCTTCSSSSGECEFACNACLSSSCESALESCAGHHICGGEIAYECEAKCGNCMGCLKSDDPACAGCGCCAECFPVAAKCGHLAAEYLYVGVYNEPTRGAIASQATVDIVLEEDPSFKTFYNNATTVNSNWIGKLYNPFSDMSVLDTTRHHPVSVGHEFLYDINVADAMDVPINIRLFRDKVTLLRIEGHMDGQQVELEFRPRDNGPLPLKHVLASTVSAPKTFFDFDQVALAPVNGLVHIATVSGAPWIWCAVFAGEDTFVLLEARVKMLTPGVGDGLNVENPYEQPAKQPYDPHAHTSYGNMEAKHVVSIGVLVLLCFLGMLGIQKGVARGALLDPLGNAPKQSRGGRQPRGAEYDEDITLDEAIAGLMGSDQQPHPTNAEEEEHLFRESTNPVE